MAVAAAAPSLRDQFWESKSTRQTFPSGLFTYKEHGHSFYLEHVRDKHHREHCLLTASLPAFPGRALSHGDFCLCALHRAALQSLAFCLLDTCSPVRLLGDPAQTQRGSAQPSGTGLLAGNTRCCAPALLQHLRHGAAPAPRQHPACCLGSQGLVVTPH